MAQRVNRALFVHIGTHALTCYVTQAIMALMIKSYGDRDTERFANGAPVARWEPFRTQAEKRLRMLEAATSLLDLRSLPSNRLEALKGGRKGDYSIRINLRWRICFNWPDESTGPENVHIVDYH